MTLIVEKTSQKLVHRQHKLAGALKKNLARRKLAQINDKKDFLVSDKEEEVKQTISSNHLPNAPL